MLVCRPLLERSRKGSRWGRRRGRGEAGEAGGEAAGEASEVRGEAGGREGVMQAGRPEAGSRGLRRFQGRATQRPPC